MEKRKIVEQSLFALAEPAQREHCFELYAPGIVLHGYDPAIDRVRRDYEAF